MEHLKEIQNRDDIVFLIDEFYKRVVKDELIGYFFTEIVVLQWETHIPVMIDFWESMIFGSMKYKGNPMVKHIELNRKEPMLPKHFERWLSLWVTTVNEFFCGVHADEAIKRARLIAEIMQNKLHPQVIQLTGPI